jgi:hypothetical protein
MTACGTALAGVGLCETGKRDGRGRSRTLATQCAEEDLARLREELDEDVPFDERADDAFLPGGGRSTPARRALDRPMAMACFIDLAPWTPWRTCAISSRTNSPACVEGGLPSCLSRSARRMASCSGTKNSCETVTEGQFVSCGRAILSGVCFSAKHRPMTIPVALAEAMQHRRWMIRTFALTAAAITLRMHLPLVFVCHWPFSIAYPAIAWLCWIPNVVAVEMYLRYVPTPSRISVPASLDNGPPELS